MGFDFSRDTVREKVLWEELFDAPQPNIIFFRNRLHQKIYGDQLKKWRTMHVESGRFGPAQSLSSLWLAVRDIVFLAWRGRNLTSGVFWNLIKTPYRRIMYRSLFNRFRCRNFWAKDDYNTEHIIRSQELRRIGGRHFGRLHGLPAYPVRTAQYAYLDLDVYYTFGNDFRRYYEKSWPEKMKVKAVGSYGMSREQLWRLKTPREKNIVVFLSDSFQTEKVIYSVRDIATAFPDRKVFIKPRMENMGGWVERLPKMLDGASENLIIFDCQAEKAMFWGNYIISDPSTLVVEGIQYGHYTFTFVLDDRWRGLYFEGFPDLCLHSAEETIERIRAIENGSWVYPRESFADLVDLSKRIVWDVVRNDVGLASREKTNLPHLAFVPESR